jgi:predicted nuclease of restriction endonuclease-like (RecB) superfamily
MPLPTIPPEYREWLSSLKDEIHQARRRAALAVNSEMILLYWRIGREIVQRQAAHKWGARVIDQLATDLHSEFPDVRGFSPRNLKYMRKLALTWPDQQIVQQIVAQLPWGQNVTLLDKLQDDGQRLWYARAAIEHGWSRDILVHQIETRLHERQGRAITNFDATMEPVRAAAAADLFKDPYVLDFVDIDEDAHERHLERALIERIKDLLLELGKGFSFMGSQYRLDVAGQDYYLDLLFYHTRLHSYVVIDLKMGGLILCRGKNGLIVEYALRDLNKPMAVSEYTVLPPNIANALPSPDVLVAGLEDHLDVPDAGDGSDSVSGGPGRGK